MPRALWKGTILAESSETIQVEGNHYFPPDAINWEHFEESDTQTLCAWKGHASYYHVKAGDDVNRDAAWYYPEPKQAAADIKDHVAFWKGVRVED